MERFFQLSTSVFPTSWSMLVVTWVTVSLLPPATAANRFTLTVLHTNDVHARIDEFDAKGSRCDDVSRTRGLCYGGIARQKYMVDKIRNEKPNSTIFLNAGDYYQGSMWFYVLKSSIIGDTLDFLRHDAMALGNHEFDDGSLGLLPLLERAQQISTPIVACNVDFSKNPILGAYQPLPSIVIEKSGVKIGVIGFLTPDTAFLSNPNNGTLLTDEIECIRREADKLHKDGVKIIIATGHSGYAKDQEIAEKVPLVDLVVGGHSHSYLSSVDQGTGDPVKGPYPTVVTRRGGASRALVVQDFWLGKYLGHIEVTFDLDSGAVVGWHGDAPLLLDHTVPKDPHVEGFLTAKRTLIDSEGNAFVGRTMFALSGDKDDCRYSECALGDMLSDAVTWYFVTHQPPRAGRWNPIDIAVVNGGGIRGSLPQGNITFGDVVTIYPFANPIWVLTLTGHQVHHMYEISFHKYDIAGIESFGGFLHSSGARVVADVTKPAFERVQSIEVLCNDCRGPVWKPLEPERLYRVAMSDYIAQGGDKHDFRNVSGTLIEKHTIRDTDLMRAYLESNSPVFPATDGRIRIIRDSPTEKSKGKNYANLRVSLLPASCTMVLSAVPLVIKAFRVQFVI